MCSSAMLPSSSQAHHAVHAQHSRGVRRGRRTLSPATIFHVLMGCGSGLRLCSSLRATIHGSILRAAELAMMSQRVRAGVPSRSQYTHTLTLTHSLTQTRTRREKAEEREGEQRRQQVASSSLICVRVEAAADRGQTTRVVAGRRGERERERESQAVETMLMR
jgi:hypothetical protein